MAASSEDPHPGLRFKYLEASIDQATIDEDSTTCGSVIDCCRKVSIAVTARMTFNAGATLDATVHILSSPDNTNWDTIDYATITVPCNPDNEVQITRPINAAARYFKACVENDEEAQSGYTLTDTNVDFAILGADEKDNFVVDQDQKYS